MKYEVYIQEDDHYYINLKARNGQILITSKPYINRASAMNGIKSIKKNAINEDNYNIIRDRDGFYRFSIIAKNKQLLGTSDSYKTKASCKVGMEVTQRIAPFADIIEVK